MKHATWCSVHPLSGEQSLSFIRETPTVIDIIKRHFLELVMAREGRKEKAETIKGERICMIQSGPQNHHAVCDCMYLVPRVPDLLVEIFAGT